MPHCMGHRVVCSLKASWEYIFNFLSKPSHCLKDFTREIQETPKMCFFRLEYLFRAVISILRLEVKPWNLTLLTSQDR